MIFWKSKLIAALKEEIDFLRKQNSDLLERVQSFSGDAYKAYLARDVSKNPVPMPSFLNPLGFIQNMDAKTDEEKKQKKEAIGQVLEIIGH